jgi:Icc-related predicted phosphoesterase
MLGAATSDTHGYFPEIPKEAEFVIHSGDFLPNISRGDWTKEISYQQAWVKRNSETIKEWIDGRDFLFCSGNHDFIFNLEELLLESGIKAIDLNNKKVIYKNIKFYGFPYINYIQGEWNYETDDEQIEQRVRVLRDEILDNGIDCLVAHSPIYGILDCSLVQRDRNKNIIKAYGVNYGIRRLADFFTYTIPENKIPSFYLHGHVHSHYGKDEIGEMKIYNSATIVQLVDFSNLVSRA